MTPRAAFVTLLTKLDYLAGTLVLDHSLREVKAAYPLVVMTTPSLAVDIKELLHRRNIRTREIQPMKPQDGVHTLSAADIRFSDTWTKLRAFELTEYDRVVLLDSDMLILRNMDELMDLELPADWIAAAHACACNPRKFAHYPPDWTPENCAYSSVKHPEGLKNPPQILEDSPRPYGLLNSGCVVLNPSEDLFKSMQHYLATSPDVPFFTFPDQDLLAAFFKGRWKPLPYCYNALKTLRVIHASLWRDDEVRCLHYILHTKPWHGRQTGDEYQILNEWWWKQFDALAEEIRRSDPSGWRMLEQSVVRD